MKIVMHKRRGIKGRLSTRVVTGVIYTFCGLCALITLLPFLYIVAGSFATEKELIERAFFIIPSQFSLNAYQYIIKTGAIVLGIKNSLLLTAIGTITNMILMTLFAYPLSRRGFRGKNLILNMVILTMLLPVGMIPMFMLIRGLGWYDSYLALTIPGAINAFNMIIIKKFFQGLSLELEDAARIDGASDWKIFKKVALPLSKPVLASITLFTAVGYWNNYFGPMIYLNSQKKYTAQLFLRQIVMTSQGISKDGSLIDWGEFGAPPTVAIRMAATVITTVPILMIYPFVQKHFAKGVMVGSVKG